MDYILSIFLGVIALGIVGGMVFMTNRVHAQNYNMSRSVLVIVSAVVLGLLFGAYSALPNTPSEASAQQENPTVAGIDPDDCKKPEVAEEPDYGALSPEADFLAASGGELVGDGAPLDTSSAGAAWQDYSSRLPKDPMATAKLAYALRVDGYKPSEEAKGPEKEVTRDDTITMADINFINSRAAQLVGNSKLWSQTIYDICIRVSKENSLTLSSEPYIQSDLFQLATRKQEVTAGDVKLPITSILLGRKTQPKGVWLLWVNAEADSTGERPNPYPVAIDVQYAWPTIVGAVPETAEQSLTPPPEQQAQDEQFQQEQQSKAQQREEKKEQGASGKENQQNADNGGGGNATGGGTNSGDEGGKGGGSGSGCGNSGCGEGGGSGGGGGSDCGASCGGGGGSGGDGGSGGGDGGGCNGCPPGTSTPTTTKPTTPPPPPPPTTAPPTTRPPSTTVPPTTTTVKPTTKPDPTTTTTTIVCDPTRFFCP